MRRSSKIDDVPGFRASSRGDERAIFQIGARRLVVEMEEAREIDRAVGAEDLPGREMEIRCEAIDDFLVGARFDFEAHRGTFAAAVKLLVDRLEEAARFLFGEIEIAVARNAEGRGGKDFVAVIETLGERVDYVVKENVLDGAFLRRNQHQPRQCARDGDDTDVRLLGAAALALQKKREAERLIEDVRKRMRGIDRDRREQRRDGLYEKLFDVLAGCGPKLFEIAHVDRFVRQRGNEFFAPASVLFRHELVNSLHQLGENFFLRAAVGAGVAISLLDLLQEAGEANFDELVEIARGDGQEFHALEERIRGIARFFEHALVELQPREVAIQRTARGRGCEWVT